VQYGGVACRLEKRGRKLNRIQAPSRLSTVFGHAVLRRNTPVT
jgi:hypothetical protein